MTKISVSNLRYTTTLKKKLGGLTEKKKIPDTGTLSSNMVGLEIKNKNPLF